MGVEKINAGEQHLKLSKRQFVALFIVHRPWETILLKPLDPEAKTVAVPVQGFQTAPVLVAEQIKMPIQGVPKHLLLHQHGKAVDLLSHVGDAGPYKDSDGPPVDLHRCTSRTARISRSVAAENQSGMDILMVLLTVILICLVSPGSSFIIAGKIS